MKCLKVKINFNFFNDKFNEKKGMTILMFVIIILAVFTLLAAFIEFGYALRSEAILIGFTKEIGRSIAINGELSNQDLHEYQKQLKSYGLADPTIELYVQPYGSSSYVPWNANQPIGFRQSFTVYVRVNHSLMTINTNLAQNIRINVPLLFITNGKAEKFRYE